MEWVSKFSGMRTFPLLPVPDLELLPFILASILQALLFELITLEEFSSGPGPERTLPGTLGIFMKVIPFDFILPQLGVLQELGIALSGELEINLPRAFIGT
jgi:hypothetical protein